jgi:probable F420-dependent oxidoreductase
VQTGEIGIWSPQLNAGDPPAVAAAAAEVEALGFGTIWIPGRDPGDLEERLHLLLGSTEHITVATGIVSIWTHPAPATAALYARLTTDYPGRFLLGVGVSHAPLVERAGSAYRKPLSAMVDYLDALDAADPPVPEDERVIAALAPRMLALARDRSLGSHPYLTTPAHTRVARDAMGPDALLAPEQTVVLEADPGRARAIARDWLAGYLQLPNYVNNLLRTGGFEQTDVENGGSDRLVDGLIAWGDVEAVCARIDAHRAAGADHVAVQVVTADRTRFPLDEVRRLGAAFA